MKKIILFTLIITFALNVFSQKEYFQQQVNYTINTELVPSENKIISSETIVYKNNSPDTLTFLYFHLWPNAYKNKHTALAKQMIYMGKDDLFFNAKKIGGYIDSLDFTSDGTKLKWKYDKKYIDICVITLNKPLYPGQSVNISTPFVVHIPNDISRMGQKDSAYQITQWYPKPAVYDIYGWHQFPYLDQGEFYSEYGSFDVSITVPKQQVVAATGNLQNKDELKWLQDLNENNSRAYEIENPAEGKTKTLRYTENNIHDFAWFCSEKYYVDIDSVLTPRTNKWVTTWAMYMDKHKLEWKNATKYVNNGIKYYSQWVGDYPFNNCTAVDGALSAGGGMEYPQITVVSSSGIEDVIVHEVGHNWFYGILGFNEREHPFLDEGFNSFYDHRYSYEVKKSAPFAGQFLKNSNNISPRGAIQLSYLVSAYFGMDQPLDLHSLDYSKLTYGTVVYEKAAEAIEYLREYLGRETFDSIMQEFFITWQNKHPYPSDLYSFFKNSTDKNIDWFFNDYLNTDGKVDYKISYRNGNLIIKNKGNFPAPVNIVSYKDGIAIDTNWYDPIQTKLKVNAPKDQFSEFKIDPAFMTMDFNRYNNFTKTSGLNRKYQKIQFGMNTSIMNYYNAKTMILPLVFYNQTSKFQVLGIITNIKIPLKNFYYYLMPVYSFGYKRLEGAAYFSYKKIAYNGFPTTNYSFYIDKFSFMDRTSDFIPSPYRKMKFQIGFDLRNAQGSDRFSKKLNFSVYLIRNNAFYYSDNFSSTTKVASLINLEYTIVKNSKFRPFSFKINADLFGNTYKLWAEANYKINYTSLKNGLEIRVFTGSNVSLTGSYGTSDFKYDHFYWSRFSEFSSNSSTFIPHQFVDEFGGLTYFYSETNYFLVNAINLKTSIPKIPILKIYYNLASGANFINASGFDVLDFQAPLFDAGIMLDIIPNVFAVYLPLYGSKTLMDYNNAINDKWYSHFRFTFKIENFQSLINSI